MVSRRRGVGGAFPAETSRANASQATVAVAPAVWKMAGRGRDSPTDGRIQGMKLSVSLSGEDVEFLDAYAEAHALASRSAVVQQAVRVLRRQELPAAYADAWEEWEAAGEGQLWNRASGDGL